MRELIAKYLEGPAQLRKALAGMSGEQCNSAPVPGKWSTRDVVCHIADFEPVYADRMKRVIAQERPSFFGGDPDLFRNRLAYAARDLEGEVLLIEVVRRQMAAILATLSAQDFQRVGVHSEDGPLTLQTLLERITNHIPHHVKFIEEKRQAMGLKV